jgi:lysophospholipase L1-like esterase
MLARSMKGRVQNLLLAFAACLVTLAGLEGACRLWERLHPPEKVADYLWDWQQKWDGDFYVFESDAVGWPPWEDFNADGMRDRTHAVEKPEGVTRIVFLGDSVTLGDGIKPSQAYPQVLEGRLEAEGRPVEVFNVALFGWSTRQERLAYRRIARRYRPDVVVLAVCLNDIPELQNNLSRPDARLAALHERSALVRAVLRAKSREIASVEELFTGRDSAKVRQAMARFADEVRALREDVRADGAAFRLMVFPFRFQVRPGAPPPTVQQEIAAFAAREQVPCLDLLPALAPLGDRAFVDYDHLTPAGARHVADEIAARGLIELPPPSPPLDGLDEAALTRALRDDASEAGRAAAARELGRRHASSSAGALFEALRDPRAAVRWQAAGALHEIQPPADVAVPRLIAALGSTDPYVRGFATWSLGNLGPAASAAVPALVEALAGDEAFGRAGAALALSKIGSAARDAVPALVATVESGPVDRRWKAARALGRIGPPAADAVPALLDAARHGHEYVRAQAVRALVRIAPARADVVAALQAATADGDPEVRKQAALAIRGR